MRLGGFVFGRVYSNYSRASYMPTRLAPLRTFPQDWYQMSANVDEICTALCSAFDPKKDRITPGDYRHKSWRGCEPEVRESVLQLVESITTGFIWHREAFTLSVAIPSAGDVEPHLTGEQVFGGNISDEWFVCYLLFTITSTFTGLTACVTDSDGEFLLIEAAAAIPPFLSPATSNHRVWIRSGQVHLVMPGCMVDRARTPRTLGSGNITLSEGLKAVRESEGGTEADEGVQRLIRRRIEGFPEEAKASMHHTRCLLPLAAAVAFRDTPGLVASAVRAFCSGDPADKKSGVRMARLLASSFSVSEKGTTKGHATNGSQPEAPVFVEARIAFTRHLYAQLHQAPLVPAKAFPSGWGADGSILPAARAKAAQLGQKLSMGLEAAYQACAESCRRTSSGDLRNAITPETWQRFVDRLQQNGFFEGELEGSKRYREKTAMAEQFVRDRVLRVDDGGDDKVVAAQRDFRQCPVHEAVDRALNDMERPGVFETSVEGDDKEDWLEVSQADLDVMLHDYHREEEEAVSGGGGEGDDLDHDASSFESGADARSSNGDADAVDGKRARDSQAGFADVVDGLDDIVTGMNAFVDDSRAGLDGAEVEAVGRHVQFDVDKFMSLLNGDDLKSALEHATQEDGDYELQESDDDPQESSEEDDGDRDDLIQRPQRMLERGVLKSALPEAASVGGAGEHSISVYDMSLNTAGDKSEKESSSNDRDAQNRTSGARLSVAQKMHEMEGRLSEDARPIIGDDGCGNARGRDTNREREDNSGATEKVIRKYMAAMEVELETSSMGQSFEKVGETISEAQMEELQAVGPLDQIGKLAPEKWLRDSTAAPSAGKSDDQGKDVDSNPPAEDFKPVDVDMNLVKHLLESTVSEGGPSGPASNLLRSMGLRFPSIPTGGDAAGEDSRNVQRL